MRDIVTTIQAEQDAIIRLPLSGVVVIEGGPGTGKTAVALHRVAYLLYTHRERLARSGVLVVGPSARSSGTSGACSPRWASRRSCSPRPAGCAAASSRPRSTHDEVARLKGDLAMCASCARPSPTGRPARPADRDRARRRHASRSTGRRRREARQARPRHRPPAQRGADVFPDTLGSLLVEQGVELVPSGVLADPPETRRPCRMLGDLPQLDPAECGRRRRPRAGRRAARRPGRRPRLPRGASTAVAAAAPRSRLLAELLSSPARLAAVTPSCAARATAGSTCASCTAPRAPPGRWRTRRCSTSWSSCSARSPGRKPRDGDRRPLRRRGAHADRRARPHTSPERTPTSCAPPTSSPRTCSPRGSTPSSSAASPSGPPPTGTGPTGTSSSTRRRSSPPWTGTCWPVAAPAGRSPRSATSRSAARPRERARGPTCSPRISGRPLHLPGAHGELPHPGGDHGGRSAGVAGGRAPPGAAVGARAPASRRSTPASTSWRALSTAGARPR